MGSPSLALFCLKISLAELNGNGWFLWPETYTRVAETPLCLPLILGEAINQAMVHRASTAQHLRLFINHPTRTARKSAVRAHFAVSDEPVHNTFGL